MAITIEKLKENFAKNGQTLAQWARENGFKPRDVYWWSADSAKAITARGMKLPRSWD